jgi:hypothetical protein
MIRFRSSSVCIKKREMYFKQSLKKNLKKRYRRNDFSEILPLNRTMGIPFVPHDRRRFGQSSVSAMRRRLGWIFAMVLWRDRG